MQSSVVSVVLLLALVGVFAEPEPQYGVFRASPSAYSPYVPDFRGYPAQAYRPQPQSQAPRILFLQTTIFTTSTQSVTTTCTYSTAALAACPTRKRRGITADEDDEEVIDASAVERYHIPLKTVS